MTDCDATFYRFTIHQKNSQQFTAEEEITKKKRFKKIEKKKLRSTGSRHLSLKNQTDKD